MFFYLFSVILLFASDFMNIKKIFREQIDNLSNRVDSKLYEYINRNIEDDMTKLEKAIIIYLCLGDVLCYSAEFSLTYDYDRTLSVRDVSIDNNQIMCKSWSILYHRLLSSFGIFSKVVRNRGHYKVDIPLDGVIYTADATGYGAYGIHYSMSDIARIKYGFTIEKFVVSSSIDSNDLNLFVLKNRELKNIIYNIYKKQNRKYFSKDRLSLLRKSVISKIENNKEKVGFATLEDVEYRIKIINRFWKLNISDSPLEKVQLFNSFFKVIFNDYEEYEAKCYNVYAFKDNNLVIYKLIAIEIGENYYYYFDDGSIFKVYTLRELLEEFRLRNVRISNYTEILGIYTGLEPYKYLSK